MKKWERHRQACLCPGLFRVLKKSGMGEEREKMREGKLSFHVDKEGSIASFK